MSDRATIIEELKWKKFPVLDDGHVCLVDVMGSDADICDAARVSYGAGTKSVSDNETLIRYLLRHRHCYAPWMQVLTNRGWIRWDECGPVEKFAVPNPETRTVAFEELPVESFFAEDGLHTFENDRMSYAVTPDHKMYFQGKYENKFQKVPVQDMKKWGHFDSLRGYSLQDIGKEEFCEEALFTGFYLGDGSYASTNRISFHLTKDRKKTLLRTLCSNLGIEYSERPSSTYPEKGIVFYVETPDFLRQTLGVHISATAANKRILERYWKLDDVKWCLGIFKGLTESDGHQRENRPQISFSSSSPYLRNLFEAVSACLGIDAHSADHPDVYRSTAYLGKRNTLEARAQYFGFQEYSGQVYCTTTSTGLLMVRGGRDKFAFVCGNTTPLEMAEIKLRIRIPMDCWRQYIRHRTANVNEYSTRYSKAIDSQQTTKPDEWRTQSTTNKQGSAGFLPATWGGPDSDDPNGDQIVGEHLTTAEKELHEKSWQVYQERLNVGVAREQARKDLPLSTYTEAYWKCDLHNVLHFLGLRMDSHAQKEIREYANIIGNEIVAPLFPAVWQAFKDYRLNAMHLTRLDIEALNLLQAQHRWEDVASVFTNKREYVEFRDKAVKLGHAVPAL